MDNLVATNIMVRIFAATAFLYFIIVTVLLAASISGAVTIENDPIFIFALYGFVTQMIFGVSYIFIPGVSHTRYANYRLIAIEYVLLNFGIVALFASAVLSIHGALAMLGAAALIIGVLMHAANMFKIIMPKKAVNRMA